MNSTYQTRRHWLRLFAGWSALVLYVAVASPFGPELAALLGALDRTHQVGLRTSSDGVQVVLHHQCRGALHHHSGLARALTLFAQPIGAGQPDHVLQFHSPAAAVKQAQSKLSPRSFANLMTACDSITVSLPASQPLAVPSTRPPDCPVASRCLRSTLLLI